MGSALAEEGGPEIAIVATSLGDGSEEDRDGEGSGAGGYVPPRLANPADVIMQMIVPFCDSEGAGRNGAKKIQLASPISQLKGDSLQGEMPEGESKRSESLEGELLKGESGPSLGRYSDVLLLGHDWSEDQERLLGLLHLLNTPDAVLDGVNAPRLGVIGSRSKWQAFEKSCLEEGLPQQLLDQVICPIGLNIGAQSPEEIAVAVVAQIMALHKGVDPDEPTWRKD